MRQRGGQRPQRPRPGLLSFEQAHRLYLTDAPLHHLVSVVVDMLGAGTMTAERATAAVTFAIAARSDGELRRLLASIPRPSSPGDGPESSGPPGEGATGGAANNAHGRSGTFFQDSEDRN